MAQEKTAKGDEQENKQDAEGGVSNHCVKGRSLPSHTKCSQLVH